MIRFIIDNLISEGYAFSHPEFHSLLYDHSTMSFHLIESMHV